MARQRSGHGPVLGAAATNVIVQNGGTQPEGASVLGTPISVSGMEMDGTTRRFRMNDVNNFGLFTVQDGRYTNIYSFTLVDAAGVAAANRFLSLFNPAASTVDLILLAVLVETYSIAASITRNSLRLTRITTATVGALQAAAAINEFNNATAAPQAEVRITNPTVTLAAEVSAFGPNQSLTVAGATAIARREFIPDPRWGEFVLNQGEGVALHQTIAGDTDQTHNLTTIWAERTG